MGHEGDSRVSAIAGALLAGLTDEQLVALAKRLQPHLRDDGEQGGKLLTPADAAERLGVHAKTLTRAAREGRVPGARRVGRAWRFDASQLDLLPVSRASIRPSPTRRPRAHAGARTSSPAVEAIRTGGTKSRRYD